MFCVYPTWNTMVSIYTVSASKQKLGEFVSRCQATIWSCSKMILTLPSTWHRATAGFLFEWCRLFFFFWFFFFKAGLWCQTPVIYFRLENTWPFVCVSQPYRCSLSCLTTHTRTASGSAPVRPQVLKGGESEVKQSFLERGKRKGRCVIKLPWRMRFWN